MAAPYQKIPLPGQPTAPRKRMLAAPGANDRATTPNVNLPPSGVRGVNPDGSYQYAPGTKPPTTAPMPTSTQTFGTSVRGGVQTPPTSTARPRATDTSAQFNQGQTGTTPPAMPGATPSGLPQAGRRMLTVPPAPTTPPPVVTGAMPEPTMPQPTVATPTTPIVQRTTKPEQKAGYMPIDATDIEQMDLKQLRDFQRSIEFDMRMGIKPDKETYLKLQRASDRATELSAPQQQATTTALDQLIAQQEAARQAEQQTLEAQNQAQLEAQKAFEAERMAAIQAANEKAAEKQRNTLGYILGAQGAATSSFGAEKINEITQYYNQQNQLAMAESNAALEKFKAQQAGATREQLDKYDQQIFSLQNTRANFQLAAAQKMDEYNQAQALGTAQSLQNIMDVALAQEQAAIPLTDAEQELVRSYGQLAIDDKGNLDRQFLESIDPRLRNSVIVAAAAVKGAIPKEPKVYNTDGGAFVFDYATQTFKKLVGSESEKVDNWTQLDDGTLFNTRTGETRSVTGETTIQGAIAGAIATIGDAAQCGRFVNEVGKQLGINLNIGDSYESKAKAIQKIGEAFTINDIGAGSIFAYPTGTKYGHIGIITGVNPDGTVNLMDYNYNLDEKRRERLNVNPGEIFNMKGLISKPLITNENVTPQISLSEIISFNDDVTRRKMDKKDVERIAQAKKSIMSDPNADIGLVMQYSAGGRAIGAEASKQFAKYGDVMSQLGEIQNQISNMRTGPIIGALAEMNPYNTSAQVLRARLQGLIPNLARGVYGEVGVLTDNDVRLYARTLPGLTKTEDVNNGILAMTLDILSKGYKRQIQSLAGQGYDVSGLEGVYYNIQSQAELLKKQVMGSQRSGMTFEQIKKEMSTGM